MLRELALFAGAGGGILGGKLLGWRTVCAVEQDAYASSVLVARQNDGCLEPFPIWDDVCTFDGRPWRGRVDVVSGGFPCQDISSAGKGAGISGQRSGLWKEMARIVSEVRPRFAFVENSPLLVSRGLGMVLGDLSAMGYDSQWGIVGAHHVGAPHRRNRIWILATDSNCKRGRTATEQKQRSQNSTKLRHDGSKTTLADSNCNRESTFPINAKTGSGSSFPRTGWWKSEPDVGRVANGVANRMDRLKAIGNGQVPLVAASAFKLL